MLTMVTKEEILEEMKQVSDPEIGMDVVNLGLVYDITINGDRVSLIPQGLAEVWLASSGSRPPHIDFGLQRVPNPPV